MAKKFLLLTFLFTFLSFSSGTTVKAQVDPFQQIERKLFIMLMDYNTQKNTGALSEEKARQKFLDQFEDLWVSSGIQTPVPFAQIESLLTMNFPEEKKELSLELKGRIRLKRQSAGKVSCIEYQDGLMVRELPLNQCP